MLNSTRMASKALIFLHHATERRERQRYPPLRFLSMDLSVSLGIRGDASWIGPHLKKPAQQKCEHANYSFNASGQPRAQFENCSAPVAAVAMVPASTS